jgi:hypothetical protein
MNTTRNKRHIGEDGEDGVSYDDGDAPMEQQAHENDAERPQDRSLKRAKETPIASQQKKRAAATSAKEQPMKRNRDD